MPEAPEEKSLTTCIHYECRCARAAELAAMGRTLEAIEVHSRWVTCRRAPCLCQEIHPSDRPCLVCAARKALKGERP